jgi:hypothetical protein
MKRITVVVALLLIVASLAVSAKFGQSDTSIQLYWQPDASVVFSLENPFTRTRPTVDFLLVFGDWMDRHADLVTGDLSRPTSITIADLTFLDLFFGDNDLVAMWEQITRYGPITDVLTLSMIKTVSATNANPKPTWTCSLGEVQGNILPFFNLKMGTYNGGWPQRYQPGA